MTNKEANPVKNIHDKFFREIFSDPEVSIDLFKYHIKYLKKLI